MRQPVPVDLATWPRREHFEHYWRMSPCSYAMTVELDVTAFVEALRSFRERYEITYSPEGAQTAGWHAIEVRVKGRPTLTIRARPGYLR